MKRLFFKKITILLTCLLLVVTTPAAVAAVLPDEGTAEPQASLYLSVYSARIVPVGSGKIQIWFDVGGTTLMDRIGATRIVLQQSTDGVTWAPIKVFSYTSYSNMTATNKASYTSYVSYSGVAGRYYQAKVTIYASKDGGSDSRTITTPLKKAT